MKLHTEDVVLIYNVPFAEIAFKVKLFILTETCEHVEYSISQI